MYLKDFIEPKIANAVSQFQNSLETQQKFTDTFIKMSIYDSKYLRTQHMKIPIKKGVHFCLERNNNWIQYYNQRECHPWSHPLCY